jgi:homoserine dehydrogenase
VTANKAVLADRGRELFPLARSLGRVIACEASVAGGIPIMATVRQSLTANRIHAIWGILNGTSNFVLSQMEFGTSFDQAIAEAQRLGYAEADPTMDVDGTDAAQKLALLSQLAFGVDVDWCDVPRRGIQDITANHLAEARQEGARILPLACAVRAAGTSSTRSLRLFVAPTKVPQASPLSHSTGVHNAALVAADGVGELFLQGQGAGQLPTASAVVADLVDIALGRAQLTERSWPFWPTGLPAWRPDPELALETPIASFPVLASTS